ncbi:YceI family protein [Brevundimonas variabilis]|uniref:Polyisoprenoid-binding protein YceI n=1 Tax=Brevundimonas variabilis TaxID=74312 RepID=A0A7W9CGD2_9CAUL|nr:YceI family protein [Brevundimonas variabilis]MBB5744991.1 polyisoprenoid-binding protein YceI [Brevundimonas variabilis]
MRLITKSALAASAALTLIAGGVVAQAAFTKVPSEVRAGTYKLDSSHGKITYKINHLGFSTYIGQFANVEATLTLDPANPSASTLTATVPVSGHDNTSEGLKTHLASADFFNAAQFPNITFVATSVTVDAEDPTEAAVVGNLTIKDVTKPVTLDVEFNQAGTMRGRYVVGFDGETTIKRSDFGMTYGLPAIGDEVELHIEGEFVAQ